MTPAWRAFLLNKQKSRRIMAGYQGSVFHVPTLALSKSGKGSKLTISSQFRHDVFREVFSLFFAKIPRYAARNGVFCRFCASFVAVWPEAEL